MAAPTNADGLESPPSDLFQAFMDFNGEEEDYRPAPDGSNVLVDLTVDHNALGLES